MSEPYTQIPQATGKELSPRDLRRLTAFRFRHNLMCCGLVEAQGLNSMTPSEVESALIRLQHSLDRNDHEARGSHYIFSYVTQFFSEDDFQDEFGYESGDWPHPLDTDDSLYRDSEIAGEPTATALMGLIEEHDLGEVVLSAEAINPNSRNKVRALIWVPNRYNLEMFARTRGLNPDVQMGY